MKIVLNLFLFLIDLLISLLFCLFLFYENKIDFENKLLKNIKTFRRNKMKLKFLTPVIGSLVVVGFLSGCSEEKAKTVEYYKQNIPEAEARQKECKAAKELTQIQIEDCKNAGAALYAESFKKGPGDDSRIYSLEESKKRLGF